MSTHPKARNICILTMHGSKGKEADYVILLGMQSGKARLPISKGYAHPLIDALLPKAGTILSTRKNAVCFMSH